MGQREERGRLTQGGFKPAPSAWGEECCSRKGKGGRGASRKALCRDDNVNRNTKTINHAAGRFVDDKKQEVTNENNGNDNWPS
jgi:hypothetical protein